MASQGCYDYERLEGERCIRLLCLEPRAESAAIQISILHVSLDQHPYYEALSYTWGDPNDQVLISCNNDGDTVAITRNCETALRRLRSQFFERILWIDAICIDQSNIEERSQQVRLKSDIYKKAQRVVAYLGEASHDTRIGMDFIVEDARLSIHADRPSVGLGPNNRPSPQQTAIDNILESPYFERIWVIQEIVFAKEVQVVLGDKFVDWAELSRTVSYVNTNKKLHLGVHKNPPQVLSYRDESTAFLSGKVSSGRSNSLLLLLRDTRTCKSTDPRDKIYALLGMSMEKNEEALAPDYMLTIQETFSSLVKFFIDRDERLDVLCHVQGTRSKHALPSWVPDWSVPYVCHILGHGKHTLVGPYKASLELPANVGFKKDSEALAAEGKMFDRVSKVGSVYNLDAGSPFSSIHQWNTITSTLSSNKDTSEIFIDTLMAYASPTPNPFRRWYSSWLRHTRGDPELLIQEKAEASIFQEQVSRACNGRCFFVTEKGHMGLGPEEMQENDVVAVLLGGSVPFVLRAQETHFSLVGECYVYGIMRGEVVEDHTVDFEMISII